MITFTALTRFPGSSSTDSDVALDLPGRGRNLDAIFDDDMQIQRNALRVGFDPDSAVGRRLSYKACKSVGEGAAHFDDARHLEGGNPGNDRDYAVVNRNRAELRTLAFVKGIGIAAGGWRGGDIVGRDTIFEMVGHGAVPPMDVRRAPSGRSRRE